MAFEFDYDFILCESCPQEDLTDDAKEFQLSILSDFLNDRISRRDFDFIDRKLKDLKVESLPSYIFLGLAAKVGYIPELKEGVPFLQKVRHEFIKRAGQDKLADFDLFIKDIEQEAKLLSDDFADNFESN